MESGRNKYRRGGRETGSPNAPPLSRQQVQRPPAGARRPPYNVLGSTQAGVGQSRRGLPRGLPNPYPVAGGDADDELDGLLHVKPAVAAHHQGALLPLGRVDGGDNALDEVLRVVGIALEDLHPLAEAAGARLLVGVGFGFDGHNFHHGGGGDGGRRGLRLLLAAVSEALGCLRVTLPPSLSPPLVAGARPGLLLSPLAPSRRLHPLKVAEAEEEVLPRVKPANVGGFRGCTVPRRSPKQKSRVMAFY